MKTQAIERSEVFCIGIEVKGTNSLIQNNFSQKAVEQILRKHMGLTVVKEAKKPREVVEAATIRNVNGLVCVPPTAFKKAMLSAATQTKSLKKTHLKTALFVQGASIPITYTSMQSRMDMVRTSGISRGPDVRFRPEFLDWGARMVVAFADTLSERSVVDLMQRAGGVGVGEWRPEKDGTNGTFEVVRVFAGEEIEEVRTACAVPLVPLRVPEWAMDAEIDPELLARIASSQNVADAAASADGEEGEEAAAQ